MPQWKLLFRGDSRHPDDGPFIHGFESKDYNDVTRPQGAPEQFGSDEQGWSDVNTPTGVCMSAELAAAVVFPQRGPEITWVYMVEIDVFDHETLHAHQNQVMSHVAKYGGSLQNKGNEPIPFYWYAREFAVKRVPANRVLAGIQVQREFGESGDVSRFNVIRCLCNDSCPISTEYRALLFQYFLDITGHDWMPASTIADGFSSKSLGRKLTMQEVGQRLALQLGRAEAPGSCSENQN